MTYDVLSLGPARMDVFVNLPEEEVVEVCSLDKRRSMIELGFGEKIAVNGMDFSIGGNAGNNAVGVTRLGLTAALIGSVGDGWTDRQVLEVLKKEQVETKYVQVKPGQKGFGVVINYQGERTILSYYSHSLCEWPADRELRARWIYLTSMGEGFEEFYQQAVDFAVITGAKIAFNPGTRQIKTGLDKLKFAFAKTDILFVNKEEAEILLGREAGTGVRELLTGLMAAGPKTVVITDGAEGSYCFDGKDYLHMPIMTARVVERTGAGDAFGSGFLAAIISGESTEMALKWGTVNSASVLGFVGPQVGLLDRPAMAAQLEEHGEMSVEEMRQAGE